MTRENKLALVVGFALILVVGILISDHFSTARSQRSAELGQVVDPTQPDMYANARLIEYEDAARPRPLVQTSSVDRRGFDHDAADAVRSTAAHYDAVRTPPGAAAVHDPLADQPRHSADTGRTIELEPTAIDDLPFTYHHVKANETLTSICRLYFGDATLVRELAAFNGLDNADVVPLGMRLRIPRSAALIHGQPAKITLEQLEQLAGSRSSATTAPRTYTVKKGDTLGEIAQRLLGTSRRWRELYEYNKDVIRNPDSVVVGTTLRIPN